MSEHFADRLIEAIRRRCAPVCVGFDPVPNLLPPDIAATLADRVVSEGTKGGHERSSKGQPLPSRAALADAIEAFGRGLIDVAAPMVPAIKINIAFFEPLYAEGVTTYHNLVAYARSAGLIVIGDVKRADIGHTTAQYADAQLGTMQPACAGVPELPDAVTVNPYFGLDGVQPFIERARDLNRGLFVLVQTSNESAATVQGLCLVGNELVSDQMAQLVQSWGGERSLIGSSGYSCVGAVVSPRDLESTRRIRSQMPNCLFLVPGFGTQGRTADEVAECFKPDGTGAIVNASRSVMYAFRQATSSTSADWRSAVQEACRAFVDQVRSAIPGF